jgi:hypothetical protein
MRKNPDAVVDELTSRLEKNLVAYIAEVSPWPTAVALGSLDKDALEAEFGSIPLRVDTWRRWASEHGVTLVFETRAAKGSRHEIPKQVLIPDVDTAAGLCAGRWPAVLVRARTRADLLQRQFEHLRAPASLAGALRAVMRFDDVDFELACRTAAWFAAAGDTSAWTPRQVPLEGVHAKWLQSHTRAVATLAGRDRLDLAPAHPPRVHFTYLDPQHLAAGGRRYDSATIGDHVPLPYRPRVVLISENKDTAVHFPSVQGGVALEGDGKAVGTLAALEWAREADALAYWGDIDAEGFEILDLLRAAGLPAASMLMDTATYERYARYGTDVDKAGRELTARDPRPTPHLSSAERHLYERLCSPDPRGPRRLEQERIPLTVAVTTLGAATGLISPAR